MGRIKTRESVKDIKVLDKAAVASERMKTALVRSKDQAENLMDDGQISPSEYAEDKIRYAAEDVTDQVWHEVSDQTKKAIERGKEAHREHRNEKRIRKNEEMFSFRPPKSAARTSILWMQRCTKDAAIFSMTSSSCRSQTNMSS